VDYIKTGKRSLPAGGRVHPGGLLIGQGGACAAPVPEAVGELRALRGGARVYPGRPRPDAAQPVSTSTPYSSKLKLLSRSLSPALRSPRNFPRRLPEIAFARALQCRQVLAAERPLGAQEPGAGEPERRPDPPPDLLPCDAGKPWSQGLSGEVPVRDLPGYGYAKVAKSVQDQWGQ